MKILEDDAEVVGHVLMGDTEAFSCLVEKYQRPIFNFVYRFFGWYDQAAELTQDTFLKAFQSLRSFDSTRRFSTWLYTIAKNLCIDEYKRRRHAPALYLDELPEGTELKSGQGVLANPQTQCIREEEEARLTAAIGQLEADKKMALILHYFQGLSYNEIAETMGIPLSTVKIRIFRAKKALLDILGGEPGGNNSGGN